MKKIKKIGWLILLFAVLCLISIGVMAYWLSPDYDGEEELPNLSEEVNVYYDPYGIPHIYGANEEDAFRALGFVHAQDRLWQMELLRRIASGGLSEVFGQDLINTDKFFLALGIDEASEKSVSTVNLYDKEIQLTQAYLDGINQFMEEGPTPVEFYLTRIKKRPFELKDVYNIIGYMAFSFDTAHKTDPLLTNIKNTLGADYLNDLEAGLGENTLRIPNYEPKGQAVTATDLTSAVMKSLEKLAIPLFTGSNGWALGPEKTKNKKVLFANDPHISFSQPTVWYEAHVSAPTYEKYGYHLAGVPFPILAHDRKLAYGLTMFKNDDVDFYFEETNPSDTTQYRTENGWENFETIVKSIKVKDAEDVQFSYRKTVHGPIMNGLVDQIAGERPMAMRWVYTENENRLMKGLYGMSHARNMTEFQVVLPNIHAPGLNIMYGDAEGNVAWWATAKLYEVPDSVNTKLVFEENSGLPLHRKYLDFSKNPHAINPPWNYVYSANNEPDSIDGRSYPGYYLPENRARRMVQLLEPKNDWDMASVRDMITDVTSVVNTEVIKDLARLMEAKKLSRKQINALDRINAWPGTYVLESSEATLYHRWIYYFLKNTFEDELGEIRFQQFLETHFLQKQIALMAAKAHSIWWDDISTEDKVETKEQIVQASFIQAYASLSQDFGEDMSKWAWKKVHTLEHGHPIGQIAALRPFFNVGPFPVDGTREVINNMAFSYGPAKKYEVSYGPSTRRVIDFSDIENSYSILPTGQSGNPFSTHYKNQAKMYVEGEFRKMLLNKDEIRSTSKSLLILKPVRAKSE